MAKFLYRIICQKIIQELTRKLTWKNKQTVLLCSLLLWLTALPAMAEDVDKATVGKWLQDVLDVGPQGDNHAEAAKAISQLQTIDVSQLPLVFDAFDQANPLAVNWLAGAVESIVDNAVKNKTTIPVKEIEAYVRDRSRSSQGRDVAFRVFSKVESKNAQKMVPTFINDPSPGLRRKAVALFISRAEGATKKKNSENAKKAYLKALTGATDDDQVKVIVKQLKKLKHKVDIQKHFGYLNQWELVGPFDNTDEKGYAITYQPEKAIDLGKTYNGKLGEVEWKGYSTDDNYGVLDIAKKVAPHKGAVMYATTQFHSNANQGVSFRLSTPNAWKLWVNGKLVFEREEYHRGTFFDQYRIPGVLKKGENVILLKICQNEQKQKWAQKWRYQFRVCDLSGLTLRSTKKNEKK